MCRSNCASRRANNWIELKLRFLTPSVSLQLNVKSPNLLSTPESWICLNVLLTSEEMDSSSHLAGLFIVKLQIWVHSSKYARGKLGGWRASVEGSRPLNLRNTSLAGTPPPRVKYVSLNLKERNFFFYRDKNKHLLKFTSWIK